MTVDRHQRIGMSELYALQRQFGWLPDEQLRLLAEQFGVPLYQLEEVTSFYAHFRRQPPPRLTVKVCRDMACHLRGARQLVAQLEKWKNGRQLQDAEFTIEEVSCLGRCDRAPIALAERHGAGHSNGDGAHGDMLFAAQQPAQIVKLAERLAAGEEVPCDCDARNPIDISTNWTIDVYADRAPAERYATIRWFLSESRGDGENDEQAESAKAIFGLKQELKKLQEREGADAGVVDELFERLARREGNSFAKRCVVIHALCQANLLGMGGAGGRTFKKWQEVREQDRPRKFIVCNGDESEPGTFKDRELLLRAPHLVVEGVILAGLATGAERGFIYIRHEYHEQIAAVQNAIDEAVRMRLCGANLLDQRIDFPVEVFVSPGGYICGEQTALIEAIEGKRAEPRNRPPELQVNGLWDMPTVVNNVETLAWVPAIVQRRQSNWFAKEGLAPYKGRRFFSISGDVQRPGAYEVPIGIPLGQLIYQFAGGIVAGRDMKAIALSGPSGGFTPRFVPVERLGRRFAESRKLAPESKFDILEMPLDIAVAREMGIMMGAGMVVYAEGTDMLDQALVSTKFFRNESCGKCVPCRIGSQKLVELGTNLQGRTDRSSVEQAARVAKELSQTMDLTAICGLGTVASNPLVSALNYFGQEISERKPAAT